MLFLTLGLGAFTVMCFGGMVSGITGADGTIPVVQGTAATPSGLNLTVAQTGDVKIAFAGSQAADLDLLFDNSQLLAANQTTPPGSVVDLGTFNAGTVLTFNLFNVDTGLIFMTGPASGNPDDVVHAAYAAWTANSAINFNGEFVGMEDLANGVSDHDYNDLMFVVKNASITSPTPEPTTWLMMGAGLMLFGFVELNKRRRNQRQ
jgi:hypothetical protein